MNSQPGGVFGRGRDNSISDATRESVSWHPSWLGTNVSPPSFGGATQMGQSSGVGRGRGRANLLASLVSEATVVRPGSLPAKSDLLADAGSGSECSDAEGEEMKQLQQHHREWKREMQFMAERGRQLEDAMENLLRKRSRQKQKRRETVVPSDLSAVGGAAASVVPSP